MSGVVDTSHSTARWLNAYIYVVILTLILILILFLLLHHLRENLLLNVWRQRREDRLYDRFRRMGIQLE